MAILAECPMCHKKQAVKNKLCQCGADFTKLKRSKKVKYWINYRLPNGKQRRESVGYSIEEARDADGKRRGQKRENRIFDMLPESKMTFQELTGWYLDLPKVKKLSAVNRVIIALNNFNTVFGNKEVGTIKLTNIEEYQERREDQGMAPATIDIEVAITKTMVTKAFYDDKVDGRVLKAFGNIDKKLKKGDNARKRTLSPDEYIRLTEVSLEHLKNIIIVAYNTGMRPSETRTLKWSYIDRENMFIRLPKEVTKEKKPKSIPINHHVKVVLDSLQPGPKLVEADHHEFVFTYAGKPIKNAGGLTRSLRTACKKAGVPCGRKTENGFTLHDMRRTVKTNMLEAGIDKVYRDTILGHSLKGMDVHYLVPNDDTLRKAMDKYTGWLDGQIANVFANVDQTVDQVVKRDPVG